jgi:integrase
VAAADIRRADLLAILDETKAAGRARVANMLLTDLSQMFRFAVQRELVPRNPLDGIRRVDVGGREAERERTLSEPEIKILGNALPAARMAPRSAHAVWLMLSTGVRVGEAMGSTWDDPHRSAQEERALRSLADEAGVKFGVVNLAARTWHLPDTKNGRSHTVHLSDFALLHLRALYELREIDDGGRATAWVFPSRALSHPVCAKSFGKQLSDRQRDPSQRMCGRSKSTRALILPGGTWTAHDLRRTAGTLMASLDVSGDVIDECLNHKIESRVRRTYVRDRREAAQARAFDVLGRHLFWILGYPSLETVVKPGEAKS